jgi:hypothetical protein
LAGLGQVMPDVLIFVVDWLCDRRAICTIA